MPKKIVKDIAVKNSLFIIVLLVSLLVDDYISMLMYNKSYISMFTISRMFL